jgi:hypothetical protein
VETDLALRLAPAMRRPILATPMARTARCSRSTSIISPSASSPAARQSLSKLADMLASASIFNSLAGIAVDVISLFIALLSSRGISTPSLQARGEQRRFFYFNNDRDIPTGS